MKQIQYTGSSKLISRIVHLLNRKAPLPLDGQGDADWGTNGQVLTTDGNGNTSWTTPQGGGGDVTDVEVNGTSVVNAQGVAEVTVPTNTSDLNNDSDFIDSTDLSTALGDYTPTANLATVATSGDYDDLTNKPSIPAAQVQSDWTQADNTQVDYIKNKPNLATVATSGDYSDLQNKPTIPDELADLTDDSTHRTVTDAQISTWNGKSDFSGSYNDLTDKPTIPTVNDGTLTIQQNGTTVGTFTANQSGNTTVNLTGGGGSTYTEGDGIDISAQNEISVDTTFTEASTRANIASGDTFSTILGKIKKFFTDLKTVAFTGSYNDLSDKPTIPSVGNGTLTIQKNGTNVQTFTANQSGNATVNITVPTNTNELTNGAGFITSSGSCAYAASAGSATDNTKVAKAGDTMTGTLVVQTNTGNFREGIRINRVDSSSWTDLEIGATGAQGITDYGWFIGTPPTSYGRILYITHNDSASDTYFHADSATNKSPKLHINSGSVASSDGDAVNGGTVYNYIASGNESRDGHDANSAIKNGVYYYTSNGPATSLGASTNDGALYVQRHSDPWVAQIAQDYRNGRMFVRGKKAGSWQPWLRVALYSECLPITGGLIKGDLTLLSDTNRENVLTLCYNNATLSRLWTSSNGTLHVNTNTWMNLEAGSQVQCRNASDTGWVPCAASSYPGTGSSRKVKENIKPLTEDEAKKILDIETVTFDYKETHIADKSRFGWRGVIAEDVEPIIPSAVVYGVDKYGEPCVSSVDYMRFVPYLIKMTQMQQAQIDELKAEIALLKGEKA